MIKHLKSKTPLLGIGLYIKQKLLNFTSQAPCFLIIKGITEDERGVPQFDIHFVKKMEGVTSSQFLSRIGGSPELFFAFPQDKILDILQKLGITPPSEWGALLEEETELSWQSWIGKRFLSLSENISNDYYEDRVAEIFGALDFEVEQMGHKRQGELPDGILYSKDFAIVYDCKNRPSYYLDTKDRRAMTSYVEDAKRRIGERQRIGRVYFALIAHSFDEQLDNLGEIERATSSKGILLTSHTLLYLLFKKLSLGSSFLLADFEKLISSHVITIDHVDRVYRGTT